MSDLTLWLVLLIGGVLTYLTRLSFIVLLGKVQVPGWLSRGLRFVPPAVLSAIIFPDLLLHSGELDLSVGNDRLLAGIVAALVAWRTRNAVLTIAVGMAVLLGLGWLK